MTVGLIEPVPGTWQVLQKSHAHKKLDAFTIRFDVPVPKDQEVKVTYRIRVGFKSAYVRHQTLSAFKA